MSGLHEQRLDIEEQINAAYFELRTARDAFSQKAQEIILRGLAEWEPSLPEWEQVEERVMTALRRLRDLENTQIVLLKQIAGKARSRQQKRRPGRCSRKSWRK